MNMKIKKSVLKMVMEAAKDSHPHEFIALLSGKKGIIEELVFLPFQSSEFSALIHMDMLPIGIMLYGTIHTHPTPSCKPSDEDLVLFSRYGRVHIIVCYPYDENSWKCYNKDGEEIEIEVID
ncbi:peptidase [Archaeoglobales archaeon]|nr:MAG: peptidase [Archaeoglobales archaeon]